MQGLLFQFLTMLCCCKIFEVKLPSLTSWQSGVRIFSTMKCEKSKLLLEKKNDPEELACTYHNDSSLVWSSLDFGWVQLYEKCNVLLIGSSIFLLILIKLLTKLFLFLLLILYSFVNKKFREIDLFDFTSFFCITVSLYSSCFCSHLSY